MMKVLFFLLALVATPAWAEWVQVTASADGETFSIDPATIRKDGNMRKVWWLQNLPKKDKEGVGSRRYFSEYDCKEERTRILSASSHSGPMGGGDVLVVASSPGPWNYIAPDTIAASILKIVCAK